MASDPKPTGEMLKYLPAVFQEDLFLVEYLSAFEKILLGSGDIELRSLEATIADIARYFTPKKAPEEFLSWLAGWMAFGLQADLSVGVQREFLKNVISLYKLRGTPESLRRLLKLFTGAEPTILEGDDLDQPNNTDWNVADGYKKWAAGSDKEEAKPEHAFGVLLSFLGSHEQANNPTSEIARKLSIAYALIDLEKPAHTIFYLIPIFPSLKLPKYPTGERADAEKDTTARSRLGFDTMLGVRRGNKTDGHTGS
jgi:phage tail-like protein